MIMRQMQAKASIKALFTTKPCKAIPMNIKYAIIYWPSDLSTKTHVAHTPRI